MEEHEVILVQMRPKWLKVGVKIRIKKGKHVGCYGFIEVVSAPSSSHVNFPHDELRVKCTIPGIGEEYYTVDSLKEYYS